MTLQFKKSGSDKYRSVKKVKSGSGGALKTKVTASAGGNWRFRYAGNTSTMARTSARDYVKVVR